MAFSNLESSLQSSLATAVAAQRVIIQFTLIASYGRRLFIADQRIPFTDKSIPVVAVRYRVPIVVFDQYQNFSFIKMRFVHFCFFIRDAKSDKGTGKPTYTGTCCCTG